MQVWPQPHADPAATASLRDATARALTAPMPLRTMGVAGRGWQAIAAAMWRADGALGFWRGNGANVMRILPTAALNHAMFPWWKHRLADVLALQPEQSSSLALFLLRTGAGTLSVGCTLALLYPLEVARTRLTCDVAMTNGKRTYGGVLDCLKRTARREGVFAVYKGFWISVGAVLPMLAISHATFDALRQVAQPGERDTASATLLRIAMGATAALVAQVAVYPLDTVRRRLQLDGSAALHDGPYTSATATYAHIANPPAPVGGRGGSNSPRRFLFNLFGAHTPSPLPKPSSGIPAGATEAAVPGPTAPVRRSWASSAYVSEAAAALRSSGWASGVMGPGSTWLAGHASPLAAAQAGPHGPPHTAARTGPTPPRAGAAAAVAHGSATRAAARGAGLYGQAAAELLLQAERAAVAHFHERLAQATHMVEPIRRSLALPGWLSGWSESALYRSKYRGSAVRCAKRIIVEEGWQALYRGVVPQAVKTFPAAAIQFIVYALLVRMVTTPQ